MSFLFRQHCPAKSDQLDAVFARSLEAHQRAGQAADCVREASDENRGYLEAERERIAKRVAYRKQAHSEPTTTEAREQINALIARLERRHRAH